VTLISQVDYRLVVASKLRNDNNIIIIIIIIITHVAAQVMPLLPDIVHRMKNVTGKTRRNSTRSFFFSSDKTRPLQNLQWRRHVG